MSVLLLSGGGTFLSDMINHRAVRRLRPAECGISSGSPDAKSIVNQPGKGFALASLRLLDQEFCPVIYPVLFINFTIGRGSLALPALFWTPNSRL
ncbi:MAG: hypothetical protein GF315_02505 [candidate division Zixibacteria bacterium]|nr:hypothetical protein [candidate division Zixibacteria bacterium]